MNSLTPVIGSNQFVTKFDAKPKRKFRIKFVTKVKLGIVMVLLASLAGNYYLLKRFMVLECSVNLQTAGYFTTKEKCGELNQMWVDSTQQKIEAHTQEMLSNNLDL